MHIFKLVCQVTRRVYVGLSENEPIVSELEVPEQVEKDISEFGGNKFKISKIAYLNNYEKAAEKANYLIDTLDSPYNLEYFNEKSYTYSNEEQEEEKVEYEIVEQFPEYPIDED